MYEAGGGAMKTLPVLAVAMISIATQSVYSDSGWWTEFADCAGIDYSTSVALDSQGLAHVAYYSDQFEQLKYARELPGKEPRWNCEVVDSGWGLGYYNSLEIGLDATGGIHICYYSSLDGLRYACQRDGSWQIEVIDPAGGPHCSLAVDVWGRPHVVYGDWANDDLHHAVRSPQGWARVIVDSAGRVGWDPSIAVDPYGSPHIAYASYDGPGDWTLKYARLDRGLWRVETVDPSADTGTLSSIALDGDGRVHITYYDISRLALKYAVQSPAGGWLFETVDSSGWAGENSSLRLDSNGRPRAAYFDHAGEDLKYAARLDGVWHIERVDQPGIVGWYASLALDALDLANISYIDRTHSCLKFAQMVATCPTATASPEPTAPPSPPPAPTATPVPPPSVTPAPTATNGPPTPTPQPTAEATATPDIEYPQLTVTIEMPSPISPAAMNVTCR